MYINRIRSKVEKLVLMVVILCFFGCQKNESEKPISVKSTEKGETLSKDYIIIGSVAPNDSAKVDKVLRVHGITPIIEGSVIYGISVPAAERVRAIEILKTDGIHNHYNLDFAKANR